MARDADASGLRASEINEPPIVSIDYPSNNRIVWRDEMTADRPIIINGTASDSDGSVEYVEVKIDDGAWTKSSGPYLDLDPWIWSHNWSTAGVEDGNHTVRVRSYDGEYYSDVVSNTIRVSNNHPPSISITSPEDGATINGTVVINGTASDEDGGEQALNDTLNNRVEVRIGDGNWMTAIEDWMHVSNTTVTAWTYTWNTTELEDGDYTVDVRAYDGIDYSDIESITVTVDNDKKDSDSTPGFEALSLVVALAAVLLLMRRRLQQ